MSVGNFVASLIELPYRILKLDSKIPIYKNGIDNNYPERVERVINNSATAKPCAQLLKKFLVRKGFEGGYNDTIVNKEKGITLRQLLSDIAYYFAYQKGCFIHANVNLAGEITSLEALPYKEGRVGKKDDKQYNGKFGFSDKWMYEADGDSKTKVKSADVNWFDAFNLKTKVIEAQMKSAGGPEKYKGQIFFLNPEKSTYPLAFVDNVLNDADSEYRASVYKNNSLRKGFFGKKIFITPPLLGDFGYMTDEELRNLPSDRLHEYRTRIDERKNFKRTVQDFIGVENNDGAMHWEAEIDEEGSIDKTMKVIDIDTNIDDKLFSYTEESASSNIRKAFNNVPSILIENKDGSVFGDSGKMMEEAKLFYQEETQDDVDFIQEKLNFLMKNFADFNYPENGLKIQPLVKRKEVEIETN